MALVRCRICLQSDKQDYKSLFDKHENGSCLLSDKFMSLTKLTIHIDDGLPNLICVVCLKWFNYCLEFIKLCEQSDLKLRCDKNKQENVINENFKGPEVKDKYDPSYYNTNDIGQSTSTYDKSKIRNSKKIEKYQCFSCGKILSSRFRLKTHLITHTGERPFSCASCGKSFSLAQTLNVHNRIHTGEKPFRCSTCGIEFAQAAGLSAHERKHTGTLPYLCNLCPKKFRTSGHLQYHIRKHTGEKKFECDVCNHAFITCHDLKQHTLTHTGAKPFVCSICGLCLTRSWNLKKHMKLTHPDEKVEA